MRRIRKAEPMDDTLNELPRAVESPPNAKAKTSPAREVTTTKISLSVEGNETEQEITVLRFGTPGARPKVYLQAGLHADELPGMLVLRDLVQRLTEAAARGDIVGEVVVVPIANPIGLTQHDNGRLAGRFDTRSGANFNRGFIDLAAAIEPGIAEALGPDANANVAAIRSAMSQALSVQEPTTDVEQMQLRLMELAFDADVVLDLHADEEALMHLYTGTALWPAFTDLAAELDARAILLCAASGGHPFDEACSAPWWQLSAAFPDNPIPPACSAATVELRSNNKIEDGLYQSDAAAIFRFLVRRGVVAGEVRSLPRLLAEATPLEAMQQVTAPADGIVVYRARLGDTVRTGDVVAQIIDPLGDAVDVVSDTDGLLFARHDQPYAWTGRVIGKIAGTEPLPERTGDLLTD